MYICTHGACPPTRLVAIEVLHHVLKDEVAIQLVWVIILIAPTAVLVGPLHHQLSVLPSLRATLKVFLQAKIHTQIENVIGSIRKWLASPKKGL